MEEKIMSFFNQAKFFEGPYLFTSITNYDIDKTKKRSPKKFYHQGIPPMFLHNLSATLLFLFMF